ncbi:hypothetical protein CMK12_14070 [Candidatus Poribacteria bacterium]|nr:hypothetical protein [Candidatus Poribacteria bacterium]
MKRVTTNHLLVITIIVNMSCFISACGSRQKAHFNRGLTYYNRGQLEQSIAEYQKAIQIKPDFAQAHNNLGNVYYNQGKLEEAVVEYQGAIAINPNYAKAHYNLGVVYHQQGKLEQAAVQYQQAIASNSKEGKRGNNSGVTYSDPDRLVFGMAGGNPTTNPNYGRAHYYLAQIYSVKNEKEQAIEWLEKAIVLEAGLMEYSKVDRGFDNIRQSPEFQRLINSQ